MHTHKINQDAAISHHLCSHLDDHKSQGPKFILAVLHFSQGSQRAASITALPQRYALRATFTEKVLRTPNCSCLHGSITYRSAFTY